MKEMTDKEVAIHLRKYLTESHGLFSWPTDGCGYRQHCRFARARNACWTEETLGTWNEFVERYAQLAEIEALDVFDTPILVKYRVAKIEN